MKTSEILDLIDKLEIRNNNYWNFYTLVTLAICGWILSQNSEVGKGVKYSLIFGNAVFNLMNLTMIYRTTARIEAFEYELKRLVSLEENISTKLNDNLSKPFLKNRLKYTVVSHLSIDFFLVLFILFGLK